MADNIITVDALERNSGILDDDLFYTLNRNKTEHDDMDAKTTAEQVKNYVRPPNADATTDGLVTATEQRLGGKKIFTGGIQVGEADGANCDLTVEKNAEVKGDVAVGGNLTLTGDLVVDGEVRRVETQSLEVAENEIVTRKDATTGLGIDDDAGNKYTGLRARKYDGTNDGRLVFDKDGVARVGDVGSEQPLATRVETPANGTLAIWNSTLNRYEPITQGEAGDLLESQGQGEKPHFTTLPKVSIKKVTQTQQSNVSSGENVWECELTNGVKSNFIVKNGKDGKVGDYIGDVTATVDNNYGTPSVDVSETTEVVTDDGTVKKNIALAFHNLHGKTSKFFIQDTAPAEIQRDNFEQYRGWCYWLNTTTGEICVPTSFNVYGNILWSSLGSLMGRSASLFIQSDTPSLPSEIYQNDAMHTPISGNIAGYLWINNNTWDVYKIGYEIRQVPYQGNMYYYDWQLVGNIKGQDGITTNLSGFVTLQVDGNGDLWASMPDDAVGCPFEYEALNGNLYVELGD